MSQFVLVTGATGFLGNNVVRSLLANGKQVRVLVRGGKRRPSLTGLDVEIARGDVSDFDAVHAACSGVDAIVHCAARVQIGGSNRELFQKVNVGGTKSVCAVARAGNIPLVHVSTVNALAVGSATSPANEDTPLSGNEVPAQYVVTKRESDNVVRNAINDGLAATIVHPGFMLGPFDWKPTSSQMLHAVAKNWGRFTPRGGCSVCDARDVSDAIVKITANYPSARSYVLAGVNLTYLELWRSMARVVGAWQPRIRVDRVTAAIAGRVGDVVERLGRDSVVNSMAVKMGNQFHYYSSLRAEQELGYRNRELVETIQDAWHWQVHERPKLI